MSSVLCLGALQPGKDGTTHRDFEVDLTSEPPKFVRELSQLFIFFQQFLSFYSSINQSNEYIVVSRDSPIITEKMMAKHYRSNS